MALESKVLEGSLGKTIFSEAQIADRVAELGREIASDYSDRVPLLVGVLRGCVVFVSDLARAIDGPLEIDFLAVSSYGNATKSSGVVKIVKDLEQEIVGRDVVIVEDIIDSGLTLNYLVERLGAQQPKSLKTCAFLQREGQKNHLAIDYVGFQIPPGFVVGYGLDAAQRYRNLPYVAEFNVEK